MSQFQLGNSTEATKSHICKCIRDGGHSKYWTPGSMHILFVTFNPM